MKKFIINITWYSVFVFLVACNDKLAQKEGSLQSKEAHTTEDYKEKKHLRACDADRQKLYNAEAKKRTHKQINFCRSSACIHGLRTVISKREAEKLLSLKYNSLSAYVLAVRSKASSMPLRSDRQTRYISYLRSKEGQHASQEEMKRMKKAIYE